MVGKAPARPSPPVSRCGCGGQERNVIFIGLTQNGKSSLIKAILQYAESSELAKIVHIGNNNVSLTQDCSSYQVKVPLKTHILRSKDDGQTLEPDEDTEPKEVVVEEKMLRDHIHLNLIDTPGLDDSGNNAEGDIKDEDDASMAERAKGLRMAVVDEKHKLRILAALAEAQHIHAICFVIRDSENFGGRLQGHISDLIQIFDFSFDFDSSEINYFVIHTDISTDERFTEKATVRKRAFQNHFNHQAVHHFVNNPKKHPNQLSYYFSMISLSGLFVDFSKLSPQHVADLKYPKNTSHLENDGELERSYGFVQVALEQELSDLLKESKRLTASRKPLNARISTSNTQLNEIRTKIDRLDTLEHIEGHPYSKRVDCKLFSGHEERIYFTTTHPIVKIEKSKTNGSWNTESLMEKSHSIYLHVSWTEDHATGTVTPYHYKRDLESASLDRLKASRDELMAKISETETELATLDKSIKLLEAKRNSIRTTLASQRDECATITTYPSSASRVLKPYFSIAALGPTLKYFTADNIYAAALGYNLVTTAAKTALPRNTLDQDTLLQDLETKQTQTMDLLAAKQRALDELESGLRRKSQVVKQLEEMVLRCNTSLALLKAQQDSVKPFVTQAMRAHHRWTVADQEATAAHLAETLETLDQRAEKSTLALAQVGEVKVMRLARQQEAVHEAKDRLQGFEEEVEEVKTAWTKEKVRLQLGVEAMVAVMGMLRAEELGIGAFAVVAKGIQRGVKNPYMLLYRDVLETLAVEKLDVAL